MKRFIKSFFWFILFILFTYSLLVFFWGTFSPQIFNSNLNYQMDEPAGHLYSRLSEIKQYKDVDILFLGSSHAYRGFDTRIFRKNGFNTFNMGSSAQTPIETEVLLKRYLSQLNPKMIIYEVYPETFSIDGVESSLDLISKDKNDINSISMAFTLNNIKVYNTLLYGLFRDLLKLNSAYIEPKRKNGDVYVEGGFVERDYSTYKYIKYQTNHWDLNESQFQEFNQIISDIKNKKIKFMLVAAPITSSLYNSYNNNGEFDSIMNKYGNYYNFNKILNLNDSIYFYDKDHLNQKGVEIFNRKLIEIILQNKVHK